MTSAMYTHSVPVFKQMLTALKTILAQASEHATAKSIEPDRRCLRGLGQG